MFLSSLLLIQLYLPPFGGFKINCKYSVQFASSTPKSTELLGLHKGYVQVFIFIKELGRYVERVAFCLVENENSAATSHGYCFLLVVFKLIFF